MTKIKDIYAREILDSRGNPTIEVTVTLNSNITGTFKVPSGASTGSKEALELRDNEKRYNGLGVLKAVNNVNNIIKPKLIGLDSLDQTNIDKTMIELDGTKFKSNLGANAILGVSIANLKAAAKSQNKELFEYIEKPLVKPLCMMNIINGGVHADNKLDFQEYMIIPVADTMKDIVRIGSEIFHTLKKILKEKGHITSVGDEGGFAPNLLSNSEAFEYMMKASTLAGYTPGVDVLFAIDVAASEFYENGIYNLVGENKKLTTDELINYYQNLIEKYPLVSIEDPVDESDFTGFTKITNQMGDKIQLVGDDLFVTNKTYLKKGITEKAGNAILIKLNQIGTYTETLETINLAKRNNYKTVISHRSGETDDTVIAELVYTLNLGQIKTGSLSRMERICKYNKMMEIEEKINL